MHVLLKTLITNAVNSTLQETKNSLYSKSPGSEVSYLFTIAIFFRPTTCPWGGYYAAICSYIVENYCKPEYFKTSLAHFSSFVVILPYVLFSSNKRTYKIQGGTRTKHKEKMSVRDKIYATTRARLYLICVTTSSFFKRTFKIK